MQLVSNNHITYTSNECSPGGMNHCLALCVNNEVFTKRGGGRSSTLTQPQCYQVLHVVRVRQRKRGKMCTINMGQDVISQGFHQFYPRYLMNAPQL